MAKNRKPARTSRRRKTKPPAPPTRAKYLPRVRYAYEPLSDELIGVSSRVPVQRMKPNGAKVELEVIDLHHSVDFPD